MFREEYIKANQQIKPDDDFLKRLKESVAQENTVIHFGEYVDLEKTTSINDIQDTDLNKNRVVKLQNRMTWKNIAVIAACLALVGTLTFVASKINLITDNYGLQAGVESVFSDASEEASDSSEYQKEFQKVCSMFDTMNVVIYEIEDYNQDISGIEYLQKLRGSQYELDSEQRDELVGDILAERYTLKEDIGEFKNAKYYVAEFEKRSSVCFVVDENCYIYIVEVTGIQGMASR